MKVKHVYGCRTCHRVIDIAFTKDFNDWLDKHQEHQLHNNIHDQGNIEPDHYIRKILTIGKWLIACNM